MNNQYLIDVIQAIVQETIQSLKPADLAFGTVKSTSPLAVQLQTTMQDIPAAALVLTAGVVYRQADVIGGGGGHVIINEGLQAGDKVVMLRVSGGQRYILLSKIQ